MNNTYEVHCSGLIKDELTHDYNIVEDAILFRSKNEYWTEKARGEQILIVGEHDNGIFIEFKGRKGYELDAEQEHQLLIMLLHRNKHKIQIKESKIIKEI